MILHCFQLLQALRRLQNICEEYSIEFNISFNPSKYSLLCFPYSLNYNSNSININKYIYVYMFGIEISVSHDYKHLDHHVSDKNNLVNINDIIIDMKIKSYITLRNFAHLNFQSKVYLFNSHCLSLYGTNI